MITYPNVKINLGLCVLRKREDGFHELDTLFVPYFGIHDTLEIIKGDEFSQTSAKLFAKYQSRFSDDNKIVQGISDDGKLMITLAKEDGVDWEPLKDLTAKAYFLLNAKYNLPPVKIFLEKTSPVGAGLGGGSSDAAFALKMLSEMFCLGLDDKTLAEYASTLGSDCAFFVYNKPMFGRGRGEILTPYNLEGIDFTGEGKAEGCNYELHVIVPEGVAVSTKEAYKGIKPAVPAIALEDALSASIDTWKDTVVNDFEATVFPQHPELPAIKNSLYESGAVYASMSGSGSALFAIYQK